MIQSVNRGLRLSTIPITRLTPTKHERNREIRRRHQQGESLSSLSQTFGISEQRVYQIVQARRK